MCTLLTQCASQTASGWLLALSRLCLHSLSRMGSQEGPCTFSGQRRCLSLGPANLVVSCHQCGTSAADRAIDSSELRLTTDREGRQVGQHRSHIVAAVSSACLIARAAAAGPQGRIVSSLSPGRPGGRTRPVSKSVTGRATTRSLRGGGRAPGAQSIAA